MKMEVKFVQCQLGHLEQLVDISRKTFVDAFEKDNDPTDFKVYIEKAFASETIAKEMSNPETFFYFITIQDAIAAYVKLNVGNAQSDLQLKDSMELERIYVLSEYQGLGLGEQIVKKVKKLALDQQKTLLWLGVWEHNQRGIQFYQRQGFQKFGTHPYFIGSDEQTDWLMRFDLTTLYPK